MINRHSWRLFGKALILCFYIAIFLLVADICYMEIRKVLSGKISVSSLSIMLLYIAIIATICLILKSFEENRTRLLLAVLIIFVSVVVRIIWISAFDSYQISDYAFYYNCGQEIAEGQSNPCGSYLMWKRSLFYTAPVALLFGNSLSAIEYANVFIFLSALTLFFITGWIVFGVEIALIALLIFAVYPDYWYPMTLASHDNTGILWLSIFFLSFIILQRLLERPVFRLKSVIAVFPVSVFIGIVLMMLKFTRGYQYPAILVCLLYFVFYNFRSTIFGSFSLMEKGRKIGFSLVVIVVLPLMVHNFMQNTVIKGLGPPKTTIKTFASSSSLFGSITAVNIEGSGLYQDRFRWRDIQYQKLNKKEHFGFALRKYLQEWTYDLGKTIRYLRKKNRILGSARGNFYFASASAPYFQWDTSKDQVKKINRSSLGLQRTVISLLNFLIYGGVMVRLFLVPWLTFKTEEFSILVFSTSAFFLLLLIGEAQPRYTVFLIIPFSYFFGQTVWFLMNGKRELFRRPQFFPERKILIIALSIFIAAGALFICLSKALSYSGWVLEDLSDARPIKTEEVKKIDGGKPDHAIEGRIDAFFNRIVVRYNKGSTIEADSVLGASKRWQLSTSGLKNIQFFLTAAPNDYRKPYDYIQPKELTWKKYGISYTVLLNGQAVRSGKVSEFQTDFITLDIRKYANNGILNLNILVFNDEIIDSHEVPDDPVLILEYARLY